MNRRFMPRKRLVAGLMVALLLPAAGFLIGRDASRGDEQTTRTGTTSLNPGQFVTAPVERRELFPNVAVRGRIQLGQKARRQYDCEDLNEAVVTSINTSSSLSFGDIAATVEGAPVIVLPGSFRWYRDLRVGASGPDASQLNNGVLGQAKNTISKATIQRVAQLTQTSPAAKTIRHCTLQALPSDSRGIRVTGSIGGPARKLNFSYVRGGPTLTAMLPGDAERVKAGTRFTSVRGIRGTVMRVKDRRGLSYAQISLTKLPPNAPTAVRGTLHTGRTDGPSLIVPASALYESSRSTSYVLKLISPERARRVTVTPVGSNNGAVAISAPRSKLRRGDRVVVGSYGS